ncbi:hypothetical protein KC872_01895 [Candidatus Kaiserbacteria bacterium]|nr:hypothetical protein [Candidatus Kaiserbacteria bacterium]
MSIEGKNSEVLSLGLKEKYLSKVDERGYILVADFATTELQRQNKSIAAFLDNDEGAGDYHYGEGLRFEGNSGNYSDMKIHIDDLETFISRVKKHYE